MSSESTGYNLGQLIHDLAASEEAHRKNRRLALDQEKNDGHNLASFWTDVQASVLRFQSDPIRHPGIDQIERLCEGWGNGLTADNVRKLREDICRKLAKGIAEANDMTLTDVANALRADIDEDTSGLPEWVDRTESKKLPALRRCGESQTLEYMQSFPKQGHDLAKEIAAFATRGGGTILLGIDDVGELVGIQDLTCSKTRDDMLRRIEQIAHGAVKPPVTPRVVFAREGNADVVVIQIHRGNQPVYYSNGKPYVRHLTSSRDATPDEVIELVLSWYGVSQRQSDEASLGCTDFEWKSIVDEVLVSLMMTLQEIPQLSLDPGPYHLRSVLLECCETLRSLYRKQLHGMDAVGASLEELCLKCDVLLNLLQYPTNCTFRELEVLAPSLTEKAIELRQAYIGNSRVANDRQVKILENLMRAKEKFEALRSDFDRWVSLNEQNRIYSQLENIGESIFEATFYEWEFLDEPTHQAMAEASRELHCLAFQEGFFSSTCGDERLKARIEELWSAIHPVLTRFEHRQ